MHFLRGASGHTLSTLLRFIHDLKYSPRNENIFLCIITRNVNTVPVVTAEAVRAALEL